jgi:hypothetical protein
MTFPISVNRKKELEEAIKKSLELFAIEIKYSKHYTEETLRYLVITQISKLKTYGQIPNRTLSGAQISCQYKYGRTTSPESKNWQPDIISAVWDKEGNLIDPIFAIELKVRSSDKDFEKCRNYIHRKRGTDSFQIAICIDIGSEWRMSIDYFKKLKTTRSKGRLLWCTLSEKIDRSPKIICRWYCSEN